MFLFPIDTQKIPSLVLVGDGNTGKTSLYDRLTSIDKRKYKFNKKYLATEGFNLQEIVFETNYGEIKVHIWDTAGQEKFGKLREAYVHSADMALIMYDSVEKKTKDNVYNWINYLKKFCKSSPVIAICGNKKDLIKNANLLDTVHFRQTVLDKHYNYKNNISSRLISVKNNDNIKESLEWLLSKHFNRPISFK